MKLSLMKTSQGLTLLELLIVMAIVAIFAMIGVPSFNSFMATERLSVATNELYNAYRFARNEALKTSSSMILAANDGDWEGSEKWRNGWTVENSAAELLFVSKIPHSSVKISSAVATLTVKGMGAVDSAVDFSISSSEGTTCITILTSGQSKVGCGEE